MRCVTVNWVSVSIEAGYPVEEAPYLCDPRGVALSDTSETKGRRSTTPSQGKKRKLDETALHALVFPLQTASPQNAPQIEFIESIADHFCSITSLDTRLRKYLLLPAGFAFMHCVDSQSTLQSPQKFIRYADRLTGGKTRSLEALCTTLRLCAGYLEIAEKADREELLIGESDEIRCAAFKSVAEQYREKVKGLAPPWVVPVARAMRLLSANLIAWDEVCRSNGISHRIFARLQCSLSPASVSAPYSLFLDAVEAGCTEEPPTKKPCPSIQSTATSYPMHPYSSTLICQPNTPFPPSWRAAPIEGKPEEDEPENESWSNVPCVAQCFSVESCPLQSRFVNLAGFDVNAGRTPTGVGSMWWCCEAEEVVGLLKEGVTQGAVVWKSLRRAVDVSMGARHSSDKVLCAVLCSVNLEKESPKRPRGSLDKELLELQLAEIEEEEIRSDSQQRRLAQIQALLAEDATQPEKSTLPRLPGMPLEDFEPISCPYSHVEKHIIEAPAECLPHYIFVLSFPHVG